MLTIYNFHKIIRLPLNFNGEYWVVVEVTEHMDRYDFLLHKMVARAPYSGTTISISRKPELGISYQRVYRVSKNWSPFDNWVSADWIADKDNIIELFKGLC